MYINIKLMEMKILSFWDVMGFMRLKLIYKYVNMFNDDCYKIQLFLYLY